MLNLGAGAKGQVGTFIANDISAALWEVENDCSGEGKGKGGRVDLLTVNVPQGEGKGWWVEAVGKEPQPKVDGEVKPKGRGPIEDTLPEY